MAKIKITSNLSNEFSSIITIDDISYSVITEDLGIKTCAINTRVYLKGEIVFSEKFNYTHLIKQKNSSARITELMNKQHKSVIDSFIAVQSRKKKAKSEYFEEFKNYLKFGKGEAAINSVRDALKIFPDDPFFLSYYGCLLAVVENNVSEGIKRCRDAINRLDADMPLGREFHYPVLYLNLGRAYLKGRRKKDAIAAFKKGLKNDPDNSELMKELGKLGARREPPVSLLERSNPLNKYIGLLISRISR
jgi:tetratricopeptide (TPR) repeat protein